MERATVTVTFRKKALRNVCLPADCRVSVYDYDAPKDWLIDKDPSGKSCYAQHWTKRDKDKKDFTHVVEVFVRCGKVCKIKAPKSIDVVIVEEK